MRVICEKCSSLCITFYLKCFDVKCMGGEVLLLIILFSPWVGSLFTYKLMRLYVEGAPISEYKPMRLYACEYGTHTRSMMQRL